MQIFVIGMHRSGTSLTARLLNLMGAYFGPEGISTGANQENPKGFWERKDVRNINDMILRSVPTEWDRINNFSIEKIPEAAISDFNSKVVRLILELDGHRPWFLKEPRFCLTFPLWRQFLEFPICIHVYRSPIQVAQSLRARNGFTLQFSIALWEKYTLEALKATQGYPNILVLHSEILENPLKAVTNLYQQLIDLGCQGLRIPNEKEILAFVSSSLYRQRGPASLESGFINKNQAALIESFEKKIIPSSNDIDNLNLSAGAEEILNFHEENLVLTEKFDQIKISHTELQHILEDKAKVEITLHQQIQHFKTTQSDLTKEKEQLQTFTKALESSLKDKESTETTLRQQIQYLQTTQADLVKEKEQSQKLQQEIKYSIDILQQELKAEYLLYTTLNQAYENSRQSLSSIKGLFNTNNLNITAAQDKINQLTQYKRGQEQNFYKLTQNLNDTQKNLVQIKSQLSSTESQLEQQKRLLSNKQMEINYFNSSNHELSRWIEQIQRDIDATLASWRWKVGNTIVRFIEIMLLRPKSLLAVDHIQSILQSYTKKKINRPEIHIKEVGEISKTSANIPTALNKSESGPVLQNTHQNLTLNLNSDISISQGISIIILNKNGAALLSDLLKSVQNHISYSPLEIIIVDHASTDDSLKLIKKFELNLPIKIISFDKNHSFSYSNNFAARQAKYDNLLFLNNDIIIHSKKMISELLNTIKDDRVGLVGLRLIYPDFHKTFPNRTQHTGIKFLEDINYQFFRPYNLNEDLIPSSLNKVIFRPAVTAAVMLCRRNEFLSFGGFYEDYYYGYEDVDLCLTYLHRLNKYSVILSNVEAIHNESATQKKDTNQDIKTRRLNNIKILKSRYGYALKRSINKDLCTSKKYWTEKSHSIGFVVTEAHSQATAGDYFTAMELGEALKIKFRWEINFLAMKNKQDWYNLEGIDTLIVMVDKYDLRKTYNCKPNITKIAWMRNWFERWAEHDWFDEFDIFLCSSLKAVDFINNSYNKSSYLFRIGTNHNRFSPAKNAKIDTDICFTGSYWKAEREIENIDFSNLGYSFSLYGTGWDQHERLKPYLKGFLPYKELPSVYHASKILLDDANHVTKMWGSVNSRVFDALASGTLVITNGEAGAKEVFNGLLPVYHDANELKFLLDYYINDETARMQLIKKLSDEVLKKHTYNNRAIELQEILLNYRSKKFRISIKTPVPKIEAAQEWGDYHFALALKRAFVKLGHSVRIDILPDWYNTSAFGDDVVLVLRGLSPYEPQGGHINLMWNISHPDKVTLDEYKKYDHLFIASSKYTEQLKSKLNTPITELLQCTDPKLFGYNPVDIIPNHKVLFVGNSRKQYRKIVQDALKIELPLSVYGTNWQNFIPESIIKGEHIPNKELAYYYSRANIVLNDHWDTMREYGFLSNRLFDAVACGARVISDPIVGLERVFGSFVSTYQTLDEFKFLFLKLSDENQGDHHKRLNFAESIREEHSFEKRVNTIINVIEEINLKRSFSDIPHSSASSTTIL